MLEIMEDCEKKKVIELLKEMRNENEKEAGNRVNEEGCLNWMYKQSSDLINREDYLLGKSIDKSFEVLNNGGNLDPVGRISEQSNVPKRLLDKTECTDQVDIAKKILEDPLYAIKQKEMEARKKLLSNPVKLKQIKQMLLEKSKKSESSKKHKKKLKKNKLPMEKLDFEILKLLKKFSDKKIRKALNKVMETDSDYSSDSSIDVKKRKSKILKKKKRRSHSSSTETTDSETGATSTSSDSEDYKKRKRKLKLNKQSSQEKKKVKSMHSSTSDSDSSKDDDNKKFGKHYNKKNYSDHSKSNKTRNKNNSQKSAASSSSDSSSSSSSSSDSSSDSSDNNGNKKAKKLKHKIYKKSKVDKKNNEEEIKNKKGFEKTLRKNNKKKIEIKKSKHEESSSRNEDFRKNYGLMMPDGSVPVVEKRKVESCKYEKPKETKSKYVAPPISKPLSEKEQKKKLKQMMEDAKLRKREREKNIANHRKIEAEEKEPKSYDDDFMRRQMSHLTSQGTMADRIKSNINNLQRSKSSMDSSFVRK